MTPRVPTLGRLASLRWRTDLGGLVLAGRALAVREPWGGGAWAFRAGVCGPEVLVVPEGDADCALAALRRPLAELEVGALGVSPRVPEDTRLAASFDACRAALDRLVCHALRTVPTGQRVDLLPLALRGAALDVLFPWAGSAEWPGATPQTFNQAQRFLGALASPATWAPWRRPWSRAWAGLPDAREWLLRAGEWEGWHDGAARRPDFLRLVLFAEELALAAAASLAHRELARMPGAHTLADRRLAARLFLGPVPLQVLRVGANSLTLPTSGLRLWRQLVAVDCGLGRENSRRRAAVDPFVRAALSVADERRLAVDPHASLPRRVGLAYGPPSLLAWRSKS